MQGYLWPEFLHAYHHLNPHSKLRYISLKEVNLRFITAENFRGFLDRIRHTDFCIQILFCGSTFLTLFNSEVAFYSTIFPAFSKKRRKYFSSIFSSTTHMRVSAVATQTCGTGLTYLFLILSLINWLLQTDSFTDICKNIKENANRSSV